MKIYIPTIKVWELVIKDSPECPELLKSLEVSLSFPMLMEQGEKGLNVRYFIFSTELRSGSSWIYAPTMFLDVSIGNNSVKIVENKIINDMYIYAQNFPVRILIGETNTYFRFKQELCLLYDNLVETFYSEITDDLKDRFKLLFIKNSVQELLPYYFLGCPSFFERLGMNSNIIDTEHR